MNKIERQQMTDLFWKICDVIFVTQPELGMAVKREEIETKGMNLKNLDEMMDMLRFNVKYLMFDLEACRRDMAKLVDIINSGGANHDCNENEV